MKSKVSEDKNDSGDNPVSISVFFPCHNEQGNVARTVSGAVDVLNEISADYEVIIVDDGSTDDTARIAEALAEENARIRVVSHPTNLGYGAALQSGFRAATKELVFYTDGDGQFDIKELPPLLPLIKKYDIVSCYRIDRQDSILRKVNAWAWTKLVCLLFRMKIRDIDCAFKLFKRKIFETIEMKSTGALIDAEILARAIRRGYTVAQTGIHHYPRLVGEQSGANFGVIIRAFKELLKLRKQISKSD